MRTLSRLILSLAALAACSLAAPVVRPVEAQVSGEMRDRGLKMLEQLRKSLNEYYYDSTFSGVDMAAAYQKAENAIRNAQDNNRLMAALADYLLTLQDSHTWFSPPAKVARVDYGIRTGFIGDSLFILGVKKDSDAAAKGLKVGDVILKWDAFTPHRPTWWIVDPYVYQTLSPREAMKLVVRSPGDAATRDVVFKAKVNMGERIIDPDDPNQMRRLMDEYEREGQKAWHHFASLGDSVLVWKMDQFVGEDEENIDEMLKLAKKHKALVFDLRNNGGGRVSTLQYLNARFHDRDFLMYNVRERKGLRPMRIKGEKEPFRGMLVVLINSGSASAAEITSRSLQLEGRAIIVGDRSMGAVVTSISPGYQVGFGRVLTYGMSVTVADVIMPDGKRLEKVGVIPDHVVLPSGADIAAGRDPQMAKALELVGYTIDPVAAAQVYRRGGGTVGKAK